MMVECVIDETDPFYNRLKQSPMLYVDNISLSSKPSFKSPSVSSSRTSKTLSSLSTKREKSSKSNEIVVIVGKIEAQTKSSVTVTHQLKERHKKFNGIASKKSGAAAATEEVFTVEGDEKVKKNYRALFRLGLFLWWWR